MEMIQPQAIDMEKAVLGAIMLEREAFETVKDYLIPDHFYHSAHRTIYQAIEKIHKRRDPIDILSVTMELKKTNLLDGVGGAYYVTTLTNGVTASTNIDFHGRIVYQKFLAREMIKLGTSITANAYDNGTDIIGLLSESVSELRKLENRIIDEGKSDDIDQIIQRTFDAMNHAKANEGILGHSIGIKAVDSYLCGLQKKTVYVIAARPGMGKSALVKTIFVNLALQKIKVKLFSLEVSAEKFMMNIFSDILETNNQQIFKGQLSEDQLVKLRGKLETVKTYMDIDDKAGITIQYLEKKVKKAVRDGCQVVMIDYLQLMTVLKTDVDPKNREQVISFLCSNIKRIASENDIPIIELAQLSREVEKRQDKRPMLSDLRESGSIEQDAEVVMFVYRPEYYGTKTDKKGNDLRGLAQIIIAKNRNGALGPALVKFTPEYTKFEDFVNPESNQLSLMEDEQEVHTDNNSDNPQF